MTDDNLTSVDLLILNFLDNGDAERSGRPKELNIAMEQKRWRFL